MKNKYSIFSLIKNAFSYHENWEKAWKDPEPKKEYDAVIIGGGRLGKSSVEFMKQNKSETFRIVPAFDPNKRLIGKKISNLKIQNMKDLNRTVKSRNIKGYSYPC